jgi:predicted transcriptional regulator
MRFPARRRVVKTYSKKSPISRLKQTTITQIDFLEPIDPDKMEDEDQDVEEQKIQKSKVSKTSKAAEGPKRKRRRKTEGDVPDSEDDEHGNTLSHPTSSYKTQTLTQFCPDFLSSGERPKVDKELAIRDSEDDSDDLDAFLELERGGKGARVNWADTSTKETAKSSPTAGPQTPSNSKKRKTEVIEIPSSQPSPYTPLLERYSTAPKGSPLKSRSTNVGTPMPTTSAKTPALKASGQRTATRKLVIQDSYASAWSNSSGQPPSSSAPTKSNQDPKTIEQPENLSEMIEDSEKENRTPDDEEPAKDDENTKPRTHAIEIADSEDDGEDFDDLDEDLDATLLPTSVTLRAVEVSQISREPDTTVTESTNGSPLQKGVPEVVEAGKEEEAAAALKQNEEPEVQEAKLDMVNDAEETKGDAIDEADLYPIGAETQFAMDLILSEREETFNSSRPNQTARSSTAGPTQSTAEESGQLPCMIPPTTSLSKTPKATHNKVTLLPTSPHVNFESEERSPALHKTQAYTQMDSQRVELDVINEMPEPTARSDIFISIHPVHVKKIVNGTKNHEFRGWKAPDTVVRVWIYETKPESRLRYMARISQANKPGEIKDETGVGNAEFNRGEKKGKKFAYELLELYELNNPVSYANMKEYGWIKVAPQTFSFVPPAVVSQLQANLRCRLLVDAKSEHDEDDFSDIVPDSQAECNSHLPQGSRATAEDKSISQQVAAQLHSDFLHSTQHHTSDDHDEEIVPSSQTPTRPTMKGSARTDDVPPPNRRVTRSSDRFIAPQRPFRNVIPSSQATTTSAASTPSPHKSAPQPSGSMASLPVFNDSGSPIRVPEGDFDLRSSQLVTVSQLLPESLMRESTQRPPVIFDSEDDGDEL